MYFPIVIHKDADSDYGVTVPDLPGCSTAGSSVEEAIAMAREAIELHLEGVIEDGEAVPLPGKVDLHQENADYRGGSWAFVPIDLSTLGLKVKRVQITIPERTLRAIDLYAQASGETRSGLLTQAAIELIGKQELPQAVRGRPPAVRTKR